MKTALDTNIISALWSGEPTSKAVVSRLKQFQAEGALVVSAPVYAELMAYPGATKEFVEQFLEDTSVGVEFDLGEAVWLEAGIQYAEYAVRRRNSGGNSPKRLLIDFLIGAHALKSADRLFTLDPDRYRQAFPKLELVP